MRKGEKMVKIKIAKRLFASALAASMIFSSGYQGIPLLGNRIESVDVVEAKEEIVPRIVITNEKLYNVLKILVKASEDEDLNAYSDFYAFLEDNSIDVDKTDITTLNQAKKYLDSDDITGEELSNYEGRLNLRPYNFDKDQIEGLAYADHISELSLPSTITELKKNALKEMVGLKIVKMSKNVKTINSNAFNLCENLKTISLYDMNDSEKNKEGVFNLSQVTFIGDEAFQNCQSFSKVFFNEDLTNIGANAFESCTGLLEVKIPNKGKVNNGTKLGSAAFKGCTSIKTIVFEEGREAIPSALFQAVKPNLGVNITFPTTLKTIGSYAFANSLIRENNISDTKLTKVEKNAFEDSILYYGLDLSGLDTLTTIEDSVFFNATFTSHPIGDLLARDVRLPDSVSEIGCAAYAGTNITSINIPDSLEKIEDGVFAGDFVLEDVIIKNGNTTLKTIGKYAFMLDGCIESTKFLENATVLETVDSYAFSGCNKLNNYSIFYINDEGLFEVASTSANTKEGIMLGLEEAYIPDSVKTMGTGVFYHSAAIKDAYVSKNIISIPDNTFKMESVKGIPASLQNVILKDEGSVQIKINCSSIETAKLMWAKGKDNKDINIDDASATLDVKWKPEPSSETITEDNPDNEVSILNNAFQNRKRLNSVYYNEKTDGVIDLPNNLNKIGESAFSGCSYYDSKNAEAPLGFNEVRIPASVYSIGKSAFYQNYNLNKVDFAEKSKVETIPSNCFANCVAIEVSAKPESEKKYGLENVNLSNLELLTKIEDGAFSGDVFLKLESTFPSNLEEIGASAFYNVKYTKNIVMNNSLTKIGANAFAQITPTQYKGEQKEMLDKVDAWGFEKVDFSKASNLESIGNGAFNYNYKIENISLTKTIVKTVETNTFSNCTNLKTFVAPSTMENIKANSFSNDISLDSFTFPVTSIINANTFTKEYVPSVLTVNNGDFSAKIPAGQTVKLQINAFSIADGLTFKRKDKSGNYVEVKGEITEGEEIDYFIASGSGSNMSLTGSTKTHEGEDKTSAQVTGTLHFSGVDKVASVDIPVEIVAVKPESIVLDSKTIKYAKLETDTSGNVKDPYVIHVNAANIGNKTAGIISITANILPGTMSYDLDWTSNNTDVIAPSGEVTNNRPLDKNGATIVDKNYTTTKAFELKGLGETKINLGYYADSEKTDFKILKEFTVKVENPITKIDYVVDETGEASTNIDVIKGGSIHVTATPTYGTVGSSDNDKVMFKTSDATVAKVDNDGNITAIGLGEKETGKATITVYSAAGNVARNITVNVKEKADDVGPTKLEIVGDSFVNVGKSKEYSVNVLPLYANGAVQWSVDKESIVSLETEGGKVVVTGKEKGTATLTVKSSVNNASAKITINVTEPATNLKFLKDAYMVKTEAPQNIPFTTKENAATGVYRPEGSAEYVTFTVSNPKVLVVSNRANGEFKDHISINAGSLYFKGIADGEATITATTDSGNKATMTVKVSSNPITSIDEIVGSAFVNTGLTKEFSANYVPSDAEDEISWSVNNEDIVSITPDKDKVKVKGLKPGKVRLTAKSTINNKSKFIDISVVDPTKDIAFKGDSRFVESDKPFRVGFTNDENAKDGLYRPKGNGDFVTYKVSDDSVIQISFNSSKDYTKELTTNASAIFVKGIKDGTATVIATTESGGKTEMKVTVTSKAITDITIDGNIEMLTGEKKKLTVTKTPADSPEECSFISSNESIATVDNKGNITALAAGNVDITVVAGIRGIKKVCKVAIIEKDVTNPDGSIKAKDGNNYVVNGDSASFAGNAKDGVVSVPESTVINGKKYPVTSIAANAFKGKKITSVIIPDSITSIGASAFMGCTSLVEVKMGSKVSSIGANAFSGCKKLKSIVLSNGLVSIGNNAFKNCKALTSIVIPKKVKTIGSGAFAGCSKLKTVTFKTTKLTKIGKKAFKTIKKGAKFKCPKKKLSKYKKLIKKSGAPKKAKYKKS